MAASNQAETALLTEHFRYTPLTLIDDVINTVNLLADHAVDAAEVGLLAAPPEALGFYPQIQEGGQKEGLDEVEERMKREMEDGVVKLETLLANNVDKNFDKFEIYVLRSVLAVPGDLVPWVRLGHYEASRDPSSSVAGRDTIANRNVI